MYNIEIFFFLLKKNTGDREFFFTKSPVAGHRELVKKTKMFFCSKSKTNNKKSKLLIRFCFCFWQQYQWETRKKKGILVQTRKKKGVLVQSKQAIAELQYILAKNDEKKHCWIFTCLAFSHDFSFFSRKTHFAKNFSLMSKILLFLKQNYILYLSCRKHGKNYDHFSTI